MFIYILVLALSAPTKDIPFPVYGFLNMYSSVEDCKEARKEILLVAKDKEKSAEKIFCIQTVNQAVFHREI